jgi:SpoVK/Ycf46/Vps4 family AAA+-type ATPase
LFARRRLESDNLVDFPGSLAAQILDEVDRFWILGDRFHRLGFLHRRGYLFYGKQGGGKSSLIHQIVSKIVATGNVAFFCEHPYNLILCLTQFRKVEPARPLVCVFEDIDAIIKDYGDNQLLQWLDGNHQVDKAVNLASTNYPERLDRRIVARPRRFDRILRIESPCSRMREAYLARKLPQQPAQERQRWVAASEGFSFAALSELIISVHCLENDFDETIGRLRTLDVHQPSSQEFAGESAAEDSDAPRDAVEEEGAFVS